MRTCIPCIHQCISISMYQCINASIHQLLQCSSIQCYKQCIHYCISYPLLRHNGDHTVNDSIVLHQCTNASIIIAPFHYHSVNASLSRSSTQSNISSITLWFNHSAIYGIMTSFSINRCNTLAILHLVNMSSCQYESMALCQCVNPPI